MVARRRWRAEVPRAVQEMTMNAAAAAAKVYKATVIVWAWLGAATVGTRTHVRRPQFSWSGAVMSIPSSHMVAAARAQPLSLGV